MEIEHSPSCLKSFWTEASTAPPLDVSVQIRKGDSFSRHLSAICWEMVVMNTQIPADRVVTAPHRVVGSDGTHRLCMQCPESRHLCLPVSRASDLSHILPSKETELSQAPKCKVVKEIRETGCSSTSAPAVKFLNLCIQSVCLSGKWG